MKLQLFTKTFEKNEFSAILGKHKSNFWILLAVFLCSIGALEFSRSGTKYLRYKMDDPFINWIEIGEQANFDEFQRDVWGPDVQKRFNIAETEANNFINANVGSVGKKKFFVEGQTIAFDSRLLGRILDDDNAVVRRSADIRENDFGWIVTQDFMERLGYDNPKNYPLYITLTEPGHFDTIAKWHAPVLGENYLCIPIPVIAVVRQLPDMLDFIAPNYYLTQHEDSGHPFLITQHPEYFGDLRFEVEDTTGVRAKVCAALDKHGVRFDRSFEVDNDPYSLRPAYKVRVTVYDSLMMNLNDAAQELFDANPDMYRIYDYRFDVGMELRTNYISFMFEDLSSVPAFAKWAKDEYGVKFDMAQIEAKKNFETFNILASVLCVAIIVLSVLFVAIFLWFLIDAHFRAISKNLGTIMAFGLPNRTIIRIYRGVFLRMILYGLGVAVAALGLLEVFLLIVGVTREGGMGYISLCDWLVWTFIIVVPLLTMLVVTLTMRRKLEAKPGDLIFERNN